MCENASKNLQKGTLKCIKAETNTNFYLYLYDFKNTIQKTIDPKP